MKAISLIHLFPRYEGQWVALAEDDERTVVGSAKSLKTAIKRANKSGHRNPIMFKVPTGMLAYVGSC